MSTRGSYGFILNDKPILFFNHFDSYPMGIGIEILEFIKKLNKKNDWNNFKNIISKIRFDDNVENDNDDHPHQFRKPERILNLMYEGKIKEYGTYNDFIKNSLFCEYAYILNLDTMKLEFYRGFQIEPQKNNRFELQSDRGYYPCRLVGIWNIIDCDVLEISNKMNVIKESENNIFEDESVNKHFRKRKLEKIEYDNK